MQRTIVFFVPLALCAWSTASLGAQTVPCTDTSASAPVVDGRDTDRAWQSAPTITTRDAVAGIDHQIRCVHDAARVYIVVKFPDPKASTEHKSLDWNEAQKRYVVGSKREDTIVLKWSMEPAPVDISLSADAGYRADIWYWKSYRTDHAGFADDKFHIYADKPMKKAKRLLSKSDQRFYLLRRGDAGRSAYKTYMPPAFEGTHVRGITLRQPEGSRADVLAKGAWGNGMWTVEFSRALDTGHDDDVQFSRDRTYQFGISRFEIAGRRPAPKLDEPLFGSGEVGERLTLRFVGS